MWSYRGLWKYCDQEQIRDMLLSFRLLGDTDWPEEKILAVSHCNCPERAKMVKDALAQKAGFKDIIVLDTAGVSSMYANDGGVIVVV